MKEIKSEWIKDKIKNWQFATCPTETKEPFFWKWNEYGLKMLVCYIRKLLEEQREEWHQNNVDKVLVKKVKRC